MFYEFLSGILIFYFLSGYIRKFVKKLYGQPIIIEEDSSDAITHYRNVDFKLETESFIKIQNIVDIELTKFLEKFVEVYISSYTNFLGLSQDFLLELRHCLRLAVNNLVISLNKVDISKLLMDRLIPLFISHSFTLLSSAEALKKATNLRQVFEENFANTIHPALSSKDLTENSYQKYLAESVVRKWIPQKFLNSKKVMAFLSGIVSNKIISPLVEYLSDPESINRIFASISSDEPSNFDSFNAERKKVPILYRFHNWSQDQQLRISSPPECMKLSFQKVQTSHTWRLKFLEQMDRNQLSKASHFKNIFVEFNDKILGAEGVIQDDVMETVILRANTICKSYLLDSSDDRICFPKNFIDFYLNVSTQNTKENLDSMMKIFFFAHSEVELLMENYFMKLFNQSYMFFGLIFKNSLESARKSMLQGGPDNFFFLAWDTRYISTRPKEQLQTFSHRQTGSNASMNIFHDEINPIDNLEPSQASADEDCSDTALLTNKSMDPDEKLLELDLELLDEQEPSIEHDISQYSVKIFDSKPSPNKDDAVYSIMVKILPPSLVNNPVTLSTGNISDPLDAKLPDLITKSPSLVSAPYVIPQNNKSWIIRRCYEEFVCIDRFLHEFYGNYLKVELPGKKFTSHNSLMPKLQAYIDSLLRHPHLRHNTLLHEFLTNQGELNLVEFNKITNSSGLKSFQSILDTVISKRNAKTSQYIDNYIQNLAISLEGPQNQKKASKSSQPKLPLFELKMSTIKKHDMTIPMIVALYSTKCNQSESHFWKPFHSLSWKLVQLLCYIIRYPYSMGLTLRFFMTILFKPIDYIIKHLIASKVNELTSSECLASYISGLRESLLCYHEPDPMPHQDSFSQTCEDARKNLIENLPEVIKVYAGSDLTEAVERFQTIFTYRLFNKQFVYVMIDEIIASLYPDLLQSKDIF